MSSTSSSLIVKKDVAFAFRRIVNTVEYAKIYIPYATNQDFIDVFNLDQAATTSITTNKGYFDYFKGEADAGRLNKRKHLLYFSQPEYFLPDPAFHYAFCFPPFELDEHDKVIAIPRNDTMVLFECSKHTDSEKELRSSSLHLMVLESMNAAVLPGMYFAAVLPKNWSGRRMAYLKWWNDSVATVAKIKLPPGTVEKLSHADGNGLRKREAIGEEFSLFVFCKQKFGDVKEDLEFLKFRYSTFNYKLPSLDEDAVAKMGKAFTKHDWYQGHVKLFNNYLEDNKGDAVYKHLSYDTPAVLKDPREALILKPTPTAAIKYHIVKPEEVVLLQDEVSGSGICGVLLKPTRSKVVIKPLNKLSQAKLLQVKTTYKTGYVYDPKLEKNVCAFDLNFRGRPFYQIKDELIKALSAFGLKSYITELDIARIKAQKRWLERQLTPIERMVKVSGDIDAGDENSAGWEKVFEDIGMQTVYADEIEMWRQRARKIRLHKLLFDFQFEDNCILAAKQSALNCNVMGLGKTLEALTLAALRGAEKILIVVPTKLIGEWQKELENKVLPFLKVQRRNWNGKKFGEKHGLNYQVIEWAEQCKPEKLKLFNLISYERLSRRPKDATYFHCNQPGCGTVVCSVKQKLQMPCPKCNHRRRQDWKMQCNDNNQKLYLQCKLIGSQEFGRKVYGQIKRKDGRLHVTLPGWKERGFEIVNERPPIASLVMMKKQDHIFKKMKMIQTGHTKVMKNVGGSLVEISEPKYDWVERSPHLKWTFCELLRRSFNFVIIDEAVYIKADDSNRGKAVHNICARSKLSLTGTPIRGYPKSILSLVNFTIDRVAFPDYRTNERVSKGNGSNGSSGGGLKRFNDKYATYVTNLDTGYSKLVPKINNPELFQTELAPFMLRHTRNEPAVLESIPKKEVIGPTSLKLKMDDYHRAYYNLWLEKFAEWWQKMKEEEEHKKTGEGSVMIKLGYLINASSIPHFMTFGKGDDDGKEWAAMIGPYKGPRTAKQNKAFSMVKDIDKRNEKALVFSIRRMNLRLGKKLCDLSKPQIHSMVIDGTISNQILKSSNRSKRQMMIDDFRNKDYTAIWAGLGALSEGANIPEANHGIFMDLSWEPTEYRQGLGRMIRPQQMKTVYCFHLCHEGTIDDYMSMFNILKAASMDEGIDYKEFDEFSSDMIPDAKQYANAIVDGTETILKSRMETAVDKLKKLKEAGEDFENQGFYEDV